MIPPSIRGNVTLSYFFWEESLIPASMMSVLNTFDAILVPAETVQDALISSGCSKPVYNIGFSPDLDVFAPIWRSRARQPGKDEVFTFLHVSAGDARKGVDVLLRAYARSFRASDNVRLVIKGPSNISRDWSDLAPEETDEPPDVEVIEGSIGREELCDLYRQADAMVLPTRGEGFNLPAAEAIAAGLTLIVTGFGGHMQFCRTGVARLVKYSLRPSPVFHQQASLWADPDVDDLCLAMQEAKSGLIQVDKAVREDVLRSLDSTAWIMRLKTALDEIVSRS